VCGQNEKSQKSKSKKKTHEKSGDVENGSKSESKVGVCSVYNMSRRVVSDLQPRL
jgi:hypothetical protein